MFVGQRDGCRLIPWGGGAGGSEEKYQTTPSIGFILSGSGRHAQVHVLGGDFKLDDVVLWIRVCCGTLWHLPRCYSCLFWECSWVHYGPLWPISRDGNLQAIRECPSPAWQGVIPAEPTGVRMRWQDPLARFASVLSSSTPAVPAGLGSPLLLGRHFAHQQLPHVWASAFCVDTLLSPGLGWLNNNIPIILSHVPVTIQIPLDLHIWGGVGFGDGCR